MVIKWSTMITSGRMTSCEASDSHAGIGITETAIPGNGRRKAISKENKCPAERKFTVNLEYPE